MGDNFRLSPKPHQTFPIIKQTIHANGKLLLSAEYFVLDGALAIAIPTQRGQTFTFEKIPNSDSIFWKSFDEKKQLWFEGVFSKTNFQATQTSDKEVSDRLTQIFQAIEKLNSEFFKNEMGWAIESHLEFPKNWGLGTSSTLIYALAKWSGVNAFVLLEKTFGGSGYDIACAGSDKGVLYSRVNGVPQVFNFPFSPKYKDQLYFIFLGKKQNSREGIQHYRKLEIEEEIIFEISEITQGLIMCQSFSNFQKLLNWHEELVSKTLHLQKVKDKYFKDYWGSVKSLGAWGGDFVLATSKRSEEETKQYFNEKGFEVFLRYKDLIK